MAMFMPLFFIKNIKTLVNLAHGGFLSLVSYAIFVIYIFIENIVNENVKRNWDSIEFFTTDVASVAGLFALAF